MPLLFPYPSNAKDYQTTDFESVVYVFSIATCGAMEGLVSMKEAKQIAVMQLNEKYGIPNWRIENILKLNSFRQAMNYLVVDINGGCKSFLKEAGIDLSFYRK